MAFAVNMPQVGQDLETARIVDWHVEVGDTISIGDIIATVESDKASFEVEAIEAGMILKLLFRKGEEAEVFKPIAWIGNPGEKIEGSASDPERKSASRDESFPSRQFASPSARRLAREHKLDLNMIDGSGPGKRIVKKDTIGYMEKLGRRKATPLAREVAREHGVDLTSIRGSGPGGRIHKADITGTGEKDQICIFDRTRKRIAERLTDSTQRIPHFYLNINVDAGVALRWKKIREESGMKVSLNDIILRVLAKCLARNRELNAHVFDDRMILKSEVNIGMAVASEYGLLVPVIEKADQLSTSEISVLAGKIAQEARRGVINSTEAGTFTISNLGMYGITSFNAIINPPECAILTVGALEKRLVPIEQGFGIADMMTLGLAVDHRAVDGAKAAAFLQDMKLELESFND